MATLEGDEVHGIEKMPGIEKMLTGIEGFDELTIGGLPRDRTTLVLGSAGTGKTVFALQTLVNGARKYGEPGIFVAIEENSRQVIQNAATFGWDLPELENQGLFFLDARLSPELIQAGDFDLVGMLAGLKAKAQDIGAKRIVFDSIDVLLTLMDSPAAERQEIYRIHDWLSTSGMTGIITSGTQGPDPLISQHYGFMQFMADCVVLLHHRLVDRVSLREIRVVKYRGSGFSENEHPLSIGQGGIAIATLGAAGLEYKASTERVSTGIERLDTMLDGGYYRGSSTLITGAPGAAKSTLAGAFIEAACKRGEAALYVSFDEGAAEITRNLASVNVHLQPHLDSGLLRIFASRSEAKSAEEHLIELKALMRAHQPRCLVIDPISAMMKAGGHLSAVAVAQRLLYWTKSEAITLVVTSLIEAIDPEAEATELRISTVADTWIHLTYMVQAGERNRALTIVKSRGTSHSNQVRELILSSQGITLADVYTSGGEVLMGTLRWEREQAERSAQARAASEREGRRLQLDRARAEARASIEAIQRELAVREAEILGELEDRGTRADEYAADLVELRRRRRADEGDGPEGSASAQ